MKRSLRPNQRLTVSGTYQIIDTGDPVQALGLALEHKPDAILLDLMMPDCSDFELCQSLHTLSYTSRIPIFVVSGESAAKYRDYVSNLGASGFFEKAVNFPELKGRLAEALQAKRAERRAHVRVRMKLVLKLKGTDEHGRSFEQLTTTENVSAGGFLCNFPVVLAPNATLDVFLSGANADRHAGRVRAVRQEAPNSLWQRYGFQFVERSPDGFSNNDFWTVGTARGSGKIKYASRKRHYVGPSRPTCSSSVRNSASGEANPRKRLTAPNSSAACCHPAGSSDRSTFQFSPEVSMRQACIRNQKNSIP